MKPVRKTKSAIFILFLIFSCQSNQGIEVDNLAKVYVDLLVVEDYYSNTDSLSIKRNEVFEKYSISKSVYDSAFKEFTFDREKWDNFFELANIYLDTLKANVKTKTVLERPSQF